MALKDIMAIAGYSGLYKFVSQGRNGIIVESLTDGRRTQVSASAKVSTLSDIAIFTHDGEKSLREIIQSIKTKEKGQPTISPKLGNEELKSFFLEIEPNYDTDRVYVSDIKKVIAWYNQLQGFGMLDFDEEVEEKPAEEQTAETTEASVESAEKPKKKAQPKSATAKKPGTTKKTPLPKAKSASDAGVKKTAHQRKS
jgi:hypothetical protein